LSSELSRRWYLDHVVLNGEPQPPFAEDLRIDITSNGWVTWFDGCNSVTGKFVVTDSGRFYLDQTEGLERTLKECIDPETGKYIPFPDHARFGMALQSVVRYELREGRLWLYHSRDKSSALVFR
jgi:hypothetical protein